MNFFDKQAEHHIYYGKLPHWRQDSVCYFVTFRCADSIPQAKIKQWLIQRDEWLLEHPKPRTEQEITEYNRLFSRRIEIWLDRNYGHCFLADKKCHEIVNNALLYFNEERYRLWAYTVAANHVHLLIEPLQSHQLARIIQSIKSYTANELNKATGNRGQFWQKEYFDHIVRSEEQLMRFIKYIRNHDKAVPTSHPSTPEAPPTVVATSCRLNTTNSRQDDVSTSTRQDDVSTSTRQDDVSTPARQDDVSSPTRQDDVSTPTRQGDVATEQPC
jgi:REP element-mobilizing transposase RayT